MGIFYDLLNDYLQGLSPPMSFYALGKITGITSNVFTGWNQNTRTQSDAALEAIANAKVGLSLARLKAWRMLEEEGVSEARQIGLALIDEARRENLELLKADSGSQKRIEGYAKKIRRRGKKNDTE